MNFITAIENGLMQQVLEEKPGLKYCKLYMMLLDSEAFSSQQQLVNPETCPCTS